MKALLWRHLHSISYTAKRPLLLSVVCSAPQNYPLYIRSVPTENELKFHYTVHTSLDVVDEKISAMGKALVDQRELYLGLLYPTEDYKVYLSNAFSHAILYLFMYLYVFILHVLLCIRLCIYRSPFFLGRGSA